MQQRIFVYYALIFAFWYSRKHFNHYTECNDASILQLLGRPQAPAGALPPAPPVGAQPLDPLHTRLARSSGSATDCFLTCKETFLVHGDFCSNLLNAQELVDRLYQNSASFRTRLKAS